MPVSQQIPPMHTELSVSVFTPLLQLAKDHWSFEKGISHNTQAQNKQKSEEIETVQVTKLLKVNPIYFPKYIFREAFASIKRE